MSNTEKNQEIAASKAGMDPKTARRYLELNRLPSELKRERHWRTREDPFSEVWERVRQQIEETPGLGEEVADYLIEAGKELVEKSEQLYERSGDLVEDAAQGKCCGYGFDSVTS